MPIPLMALAAIPSVVQSVSGLLGIGKGNRAAKKNPFPTEQANPLYAQNLAIAENAARVGLPQQQVVQAQQGFARNQNAGLRQLGRMGRPGGVAGVVRAGNDAALGLGVADANARMGNQQRAMGYRQQLAGEQNRVWDWNQRSRYMQTAQANAQQIGAGKQNFMGGLNNLSMLGQYAMYGQQGNSPQSTNNTVTNPLLLGQQFKMPGAPKLPYKFNGMPLTPQFNGFSNQGSGWDYQPPY